MMGRFLKALGTVSLVLVLGFGLWGCGGKEPAKETKSAAEVSFPWDEFCFQYMNMEGGIAACKCNTAASMEEVTYARDESIADARSELARMLELRVENMVKRYRSRTVANTKRAIGSTFEDVAKQVARQYLKGSRPIAYKTFRAEGGKYMVCAVVALQPQVVKEMISAIAKEANLNNPRDEDILYQEFKAYKAFQELEKETSK